MKEQYKQKNNRRGFTLFIAVLVIGIILAIGLSILNITLKEYLLSGVVRESAVALDAADAGMECALYWDRSNQGNKFDVEGQPTEPLSGTTITCMEDTRAVGGGTSGTAQNFEFDWGTPAVCTKISVTKYYNASLPVPMGEGPGGQDLTCPAGVECTRTVSLGYNKACSQLTSPRTVERGLRALY